MCVSFRRSYCSIKLPLLSNTTSSPMQMHPLEMRGSCVTNASPSGLRSCMEDEGLRSRLSGAGFKPPQAALVKSHCRERWRKRYRSGVDHGDERERTPDDVSKHFLATSKPGAGLSPGTRLGGAR